MTVTKSANIPEGIEIIPKITEIGNSVCFVNTTNKEITVRGSKVLGQVHFGESSTGTRSKQNKKRGFVNSVLATTKIDMSKVPGECVADMRQLLQNFSDIFAESSYDIKKTGLIEHDIDTEGHGPILNRE